jgi:hypothetical protein
MRFAREEKTRVDTLNNALSFQANSRSPLGRTCAACLAGKGGTEINLLVSQPYASAIGHHLAVKCEFQSAHWELILSRKPKRIQSLQLKKAGSTFLQFFIRRAMLR